MPLPMADFDSAFLLPLAGSGIERYGGLAVRTALDAARLKGERLLLLYCQVFCKKSFGTRFTHMPTPNLFHTNPRH